MHTSQVSDFLKREALQDFSAEKPGKDYVMLCEAFPLQRIKIKKQHALALQVLIKLAEYLQQFGDIAPDEKRQILDYMDALGLLVEAYEKKTTHAKLDKISGAEILQFLMEQHGLKQNDLAGELGSQSIVSDVLNGKRKLNGKQIHALAERFGVSTSAFFPL